MTKEEYSLLNIKDSPLNGGSKGQIVEGVFCPKRKWGVQIGRSVYWEFAEIQSLLNNLERHIEFK